MLRAGPLGSLIALLAALLGGSAVAAPRVVLLEMAGGTKEIRQEVRAAAEQALRALGVDVVPQERTKTNHDDCKVPSCLAELGRRAGASHVLQIQGGYENESYNLRLDLLDGETGRTLGSDSKECEICSAKDFCRAVRDRSAALWTRVVREQAGAGPLQAVPVAPVQPDTTGTNLAEPRVRRSFWVQPWPLFGLGLAAGGAALLGFGGYYLAVDGDCVGPCVSRRATAGFGWGLLAGGGAALLGGVAIAIWGRDDEAGPTVSLGPGSVALSGRF